MLGLRKKERERNHVKGMHACVEECVCFCVDGEAKNIGGWRRKREEGNNRRCGPCKGECMHACMFGRVSFCL